MLGRLGLAIASTIAALLLAAPSTLAGSSEAGWGCTATGSEVGSTLLATPQSWSPYSPLVKESPGVITSWTVRAGAGLGQFAQQLSVFRPAGNGEYTKVAESALEAFGDYVPGGEGVISRPARIPVQQGDLVGSHGAERTLYCGEGGPSALFAGPIAVGETKPFVTGTYRSPVNAVVEEDLDRDGYGDFSQDRCPESALFQTNCPLPAIVVGEVAVRKRAIWIETSNNTDASFEAVGEVHWRAPGGKRVRVGLGSGPAKTVPGGAIAMLKVGLPPAIVKRLAKISPRQALRARIDVRATNLVPYVGTHEVKVRLPGRKPPL
jgi:hypothetical protein